MHISNCFLHYSFALYMYTYNAFATGCTIFKTHAHKRRLFLSERPSSLSDLIKTVTLLPTSSNQKLQLAANLIHSILKPFIGYFKKRT